MEINGVDVGTAVDISVGGDLTGVLSTTSERDLFKVTLQEGNTYSFGALGDTEAGNGLGGVSDTVLRVYDAEGNFLFSNDDDYSGSGYNSYIRDVTVGSTGTYYIEVASYGGYYSGGYRVAVVGDTNTAPVLSDSQAVLSMATVNGTYFISSSSLLQGFTDANGDTLSISGTPTVSSGTISATTGGWNVTGLTTATTVNVSYQVTDGHATVDASNSFAVASATNTIAMTLMGTSKETSEDGGMVAYQLAINNALTSGSITVTVTTRDNTEGRIVQADGSLGDSRSYTFNSTNSTAMVEIKGIQDYTNDGTVPYQIQVRSADNTSTPAMSGSSSWTSAIRSFNGGTTTSYRYEDLYNAPDFDPLSGRDRDVPLYLIGDEGRPNEDTLVGLDGSDRLYGGYMIDTLHGGIGQDRLYGGYEDDQLYGGDGNDTLYGEQDDDYLAGGGGNDRLDGGIGADTLVGGAGSDTYYLTLDDDGEIEDTVIEVMADAGTDTVYIPFQVASYTLTEGVENVRMNAGFSNTALTGNAGNNVMTGNAGDNPLNGGAGNDTLNGGFGDDELRGGAGNDTLTGGAGEDEFVLTSTSSTSRDTILDFSVADDQIGLLASIVPAVGGSVSATEFVKVSSGGATNSSQRLIYNATTGMLYYDRDGNTSGGSAQVALANVGQGLALTYRDFYIV
ncbi:MAG: cadherin-like domain-containing protein [Magnetococcales bacterium]|nr:cadherin-like domain-containing protein [Magnetococcales bacterium]